MTKRTIIVPGKFDLLLNAFDYAGLQDTPYEHGYGQKRQALLMYAKALEEVADAAKNVTGFGRSRGIQTVIADIRQLNVALEKLERL